MSNIYYILLFYPEKTPGPVVYDAVFSYVFSTKTCFLTNYCLHNYDTIGKLQMSPRYDIILYGCAAARNARSDSTNAIKRQRNLCLINLNQ
jgi:hypothetical protein